MRMIPTRTYVHTVTVFAKWLFGNENNYHFLNNYVVLIKEKILALILEL